MKMKGDYFWAAIYLAVLSATLAALLILAAPPMKDPKKIKTEKKVAADLIGQTTGGRESAWLFREGQIKDVEFLSQKGDQLVVALYLHTAETGEDFLMVVEINYHYCLTNCHTRIESVGQRYLKKL